MKKYIFVMLCVILATTAVNGQTKKDLELQVSQLQTQLDSVKAEHGSISLVHDSTSKVLDTYISMYKTIQEKVLPYDFAPENIGEIIDSLQTSRDSTFSSFMAGSELLRDTISSMSAAMDSLNSEIADLKSQLGNPANAVSVLSDLQYSDLEKIKKLLDSGILTKEEFEAKKKEILGDEF